MCPILEEHDIRYWVAPRDISPGSEWAAAIMEAIEAAQIMVLVYSRASNRSRQVMREVERAVSKGLVIIPFRTEDAQLSQSMEYFISAYHWLDALTPPLEVHLQRLADQIKLLLAGTPNRREGRVSPAEKSGLADRIQQLSRLAQDVKPEHLA